MTTGNASSYIPVEPTLAPGAVTCAGNQKKYKAKSLVQKHLRPLKVKSPFQAWHDWRVLKRLFLTVIKHGVTACMYMHPPHSPEAFIACMYKYKPGVLCPIRMIYAGVMLT